MPNVEARSRSVALLLFDITQRRHSERRARRLQEFTGQLDQAVTIADVAEAVAGAGALAADTRVAAVALLENSARRLRFVPTGVTAHEPVERWEHVPLDIAHPVGLALICEQAQFYSDPSALLSQYLPLLRLRWPPATRPGPPSRYAAEPLPRAR